MGSPSRATPEKEDVMGSHGKALFGCLVLVATTVAAGAAAGCGDPLLGTWRVDMERTIEAAKEVPRPYARDFGDLETYRAHLREVYADRVFEFRDADAPGPPILEDTHGRITGKRPKCPLGRISSEKATRHYIGLWRRVEDRPDTYHIYAWLSGPVYEPDGELRLNDGEAVWRRGPGPKADGPVIYLRRGR
jgi:hypothetical protein